jgi:hypothetical protein
MKGWRTLAFGFFVAVAPAALDYLGGVSWTSIGVSPGVGAAIGAGIIALRVITNTAIGKAQ